MLFRKLLHKQARYLLIIHVALSYPECGAEGSQSPGVSAQPLQKWLWLLYQQHCRLLLIRKAIYKQTLKAKPFRRNSNGMDSSIHLELLNHNTCATPMPLENQKGTLRARSNQAGMHYLFEFFLDAACQLMITIESSDHLSHGLCLAGTSETQLHPDQVTKRLEEASHKRPVPYISHVTSTTCCLLGTASCLLV